MVVSNLFDMYTGQLRFMNLYVIKNRDVERVSRVKSASLTSSKKNQMGDQKPRIKRYIEYDPTTSKVKPESLDTIYM